MLRVNRYFGKQCITDAINK